MLCMRLVDNTEEICNTLQTRLFNINNIRICPLSCHGSDGLPNALNGSKGTARLKPLLKAVDIDINEPSLFTAFVPVIYLPIDLPLVIASIVPI